MSKIPEGDLSPLAALKSRRFKSKVSDDEINAIIAEYQVTDDLDRKRDLEELVVSAHINGALFFARRFARRKDDEDLVTSCYAAIKKTMEKFDTGRKTKFLTYLYQWVRSEVGRHQTNQEFSTVRVPVASDGLATTAYLIGKALEQKTGKKPTTEEIIKEGVRQGKKNFFLQGKDGQVITTKKLEDNLRRSRSHSVSLDASIGSDDSRSGHDFLADSSMISADQLALIKQLREKAEPLFEPLLQFMTRNVGFVEIDCIINRTLLRLSLEETGDPLGISRERVRQLFDTNLPYAFNKSGWFRPFLLSEIAVICMLANELHEEPPSEVLHRIIRLSPTLEKASLKAFSITDDYADMLDHADASLCEKPPEKPLICTSTQFYMNFGTSKHRSAKKRLPSTDERVEFGRRSIRMPPMLATRDDMLMALRSTLAEDEYQALIMFPHGRKVLYGLYAGRHSPGDIDALITREVAYGNLLVCSNIVQGEALRFWPKAEASVQLPLEDEEPYQPPILLPRSMTKAQTAFYRRTEKNPLSPAKPARTRTKAVRPKNDNTPAIAALNERKQALLRTIASFNEEISAHKATIATLRPYA